MLDETHCCLHCSFSVFTLDQGPYSEHYIFFKRTDWPNKLECLQLASFSVECILLNYSRAGMFHFRRRSPEVGHLRGQVRQTQGRARQRRQGKGGPRASRRQRQLGKIGSFIDDSGNFYAYSRPIF
jgi:hypothetical protein